MDQPVAVITGAGRGIGRAAAVELARLGYRMALASRNPDDLKETIRLATGGELPVTTHIFGAQALAVPTDVTRPHEVERLIGTAAGRLGRVDAVVHCAGLAPVRPIAEMTPEEWHAVIDTNLSAAFYLCRAAWPVFERQKAGVVVNLSSLACRDPFPGFAAYGAAKAGLNLLGLSAAREGEKIGVRVHTLALGAVETGMFRQVVAPDQWPAEKTLAPADVAAVIARCVTGELRYTSGEVIYLHKTV
jgi:NAD(P)-dependent dehydrogenase (short-subunit alcohol dehydrogenase family)